MVALSTFAVMQIWPVFELVLRWRRWARYAKLHEFLVRRAADQPENEHLRTLLIDSASTYADDLGEPIPVRPELVPLPAGDKPR